MTQYDHSATRVCTVIPMALGSEATVAIRWAKISLSKRLSLRLINPDPELRIIKLTFIITGLILLITVIKRGGLYKKTNSFYLYNFKELVL